MLSLFEIIDSFQSLDGDSEKVRFDFMFTFSYTGNQWRLPVYIDIKNTKISELLI